MNLFDDRAKKSSKVPSVINKNLTMFFFFFFFFFFVCLFFFKKSRGNG